MTRISGFDNAPSGPLTMADTAAREAEEFAVKSFWFARAKGMRHACSAANSTTGLCGAPIQGSPIQTGEGLMFGDCADCGPLYRAAYAEAKKTFIREFWLHYSDGVRRSAAPKKRRLRNSAQEPTQAWLPSEYHPKGSGHTLRPGEDE